MKKPRKSVKRSTGKDSAPNQEPQFVTCPACSVEQGDMGRGVMCESCGYGPMPYYDEHDDLCE